LIFVDSNIPMCLIGAAHPHKTEAQVILERLIAAGERLVTDAEVLQEILRRYTAIRRREATGPAFRVVSDIVDEVFGIEKQDAVRAGEIAQTRSLNGILESEEAVNRTGSPGNVISNHISTRKVLSGALYLRVMSCAPFRRYSSGS
jgi:predicted nucleic acid-binding protein